MQGYNGMLFRTEYKKIYTPNRWISTLVLLGLAFITRLILFFASGNPILVEKLYSSTIYPYIARILGFVSSIVPFSIAEILLIIIVLFIIIIFLSIILNPKLFLNKFKEILLNTVKLTTIIYILFYFLWGFNYYRQDYLVTANMSEEPSTFSELKELTLIMIEKSNDIRKNLPEDENGIFFVEDSFIDLGEIAIQGFEDYKVGNLYLGGNYGRVKPVLLSKYMSYTGIMGIFIPFTSEPTINADIPYQSLLSAISHEMAHQRGFAKEEEANFIAYKANINNPDKRFQYSGYYLAMNYLLNEVYRENPDDYLLLCNELSEEVIRDMGFAREYWRSKEGKVEKTVTTMNDNYLKFNNQVDGISSYNEIVRLLLAEYKNQKIN